MANFLPDMMSWKQCDEEDDELYQMVNDFMEPSPTNQTGSTSVTRVSSSSQYTQQNQVLALQEIVKSRTKTERWVLESVSRHMRRAVLTYQNDGRELKKWLVKKLRMDGFDASFRRTSWPTTAGCPAGEYIYIEVVVEDENQGGRKRLIVDTEFNSQFELARPTETYKELANTLPSNFVGDEQKLDNIITILCAAAKQSFTESSLHVPPWRTKTYMHRKWFATSRSSTRFHRQNGEDIDPGLMRENTTKTKFDLSALSNRFAKTGIDCC